MNKMLKRKIVTKYFMFVKVTDNFYTNIMSLSTKLLCIPFLILGIPFLIQSISSLIPGIPFIIPMYIIPDPWFTLPDPGTLNTENLQIFCILIKMDTLFTYLKSISAC